MQGVKVKMDDQGNILVKKLSGKNVYVKSVSNVGEETSIGADVLKLPNYCLETDKPVKVSELYASTHAHVYVYIGISY